MWPSLKNCIKENKFFFPVFLFVAVLLLYRIDYRTFWMDETMVLGYFKYSLLDFFKAYWFSPDNHPPLFYILVLVCSKFLPWNETMVRLVPMLAGLGIVAVVYWFTLKISQNRFAALLASFFTGYSSYFVLISQMARYHSLAAFFALLTLYFFYTLVFEGYSKRNLVLYLVFMVLTAYSDYPHFIYVALITNVLFVVLALRKRIAVSVPKWFSGQAGAAVVCLPLAWMIYNRVFIQGDGGWTNVNLLSNSWKNIAAGFLYHIYSYLFGENIFPWNYAAFGAGMIFLLAVSMALVVGITKKSLTKKDLFVIVLALAVIILNTFFMNKADPRYNFTVYPKFGFVAYPLTIMAFTLALLVVKNRYFRIVSFILWFAVSTYGLYNFYRLTNYFNASYFRTFEAFDYVKLGEKPGDLLAITPDAGEGTYLFYKQKYFKDVNPLDYHDFYDGKVATGTRVWFFATASDNNEESVTTEDMVPKGYKAVSRFDSVPLDPKFKEFKERFLHRKSYTYKYSVFLLKKI